jgi:hypothetical protein
MLVAIWAYNIAALVIAGDTLIAALFSLILLIPVSIVIYTLAERRENQCGTANVYEKLKTLLIPICGAAFACWIFDISTTYYAIDVVRKATELNPLGWPLGAVGALVFYVPATIFVYTLLFKIGQKYSIVAAAVITVLTAYLGSMNFNEGVHNFGFFLNSVSFTMESYGFLFSLVVAVDLIYVVAFARLARREASLIKRTIN